MNPMTLKDLRDKYPEMATRVEDMLGRLSTNGVPASQGLTPDKEITEKFLTDALTNATHIDGKAVASTNPADVQSIADAKAGIEPVAQNLESVVRQDARAQDPTNKTPDAGTLPTPTPTPAQQNLQDIIKGLEDVHAQNIKDIHAKDDDIINAKEAYKEKSKEKTVALTSTDTVSNTDELAFLVKWLAMASATARHNMSVDRQLREMQNKITKLEQERNKLVLTANTNLAEINTHKADLMAQNQKTNASTPNQPQNQNPLGASATPPSNPIAPPKPGTGAGGPELDDEDLDKKVDYNDLDPDFDPDDVPDFDDVEREGFESDDEDTLDNGADEEEQQEADTALNLEAEGTAPAPKTGLGLEADSPKSQDATAGNLAPDASANLDLVGDGLRLTPSSSNADDDEKKQAISDQVEAGAKAAATAYGIPAPVASVAAGVAGEMAAEHSEQFDTNASGGLPGASDTNSIGEISIAPTGNLEPVDPIAEGGDFMRAVADLMSQGKTPHQTVTVAPGAKTNDEQRDQQSTPTLKMG